VVRQGANVQVLYFDQQREALDPERSVADTVGDGNDVVTVGGATRHVYGYLEDFLFAAERARSPVKSLSGGERARLLLARLFTKPANVLILDEPTNDLDIETLELLESLLVSFDGTLIVVSHDRRFLDNVVTSTLAFTGEGRVEEHVGGYEDWARARDRDLAAAATASTGVAATQAAGSARKPAGTSASAGAPSGTAMGAQKKLSYKERLALEALPSRIETLEAEQVQIEATIAGSEFYKEPASVIAATMSRLEAVRMELDAAYRQWDELDSRKG
jgi:ATP-binding cassette subfamily F protein uup